ncbi:hypothetical protein [Draconibacterium sediminis]|nr:hypothetical protein [Draconibacterium sediminis]
MDKRLLMFYPIIALYISMLLILLERFALRFLTRITKKYKFLEESDLHVTSSNLWKRIARDLCLLAINADILAIILMGPECLCGDQIMPLILAVAHIYLYLIIIIFGARQAIKSYLSNNPTYTMMYLILGLTAILTNAFTIQLFIY